MVIRGTRRSSRLQVKRVPSFLSYFKTLSIGPSPGIEPATSRSAVKRSTHWANPARPITMKFRIRKESSKPQTNYHCCLRFSYLVPYWLISRNTITFHKYFWCWNWKGLPRNGKVSTIRTYRFHDIKLQAVSGHANKTRHYQLWDEVTFNSNRDPRWYCRRVKETLNSINRDSGIENPDTRMPTVRHRSVQQDSGPLKEQSSRLMPTML